jgi:hypothetical protein
LDSDGKRVPSLVRRINVIHACDRIQAEPGGAALMTGICRDDVETR